jgi:hypothetical protein
MKTTLLTWCVTLLAFAAAAAGVKQTGWTTTTSATAAASAMGVVRTNGSGAGLMNLNALPVFNVKNFGATGNGVNNDTVAIVATGAAAYAAGGGIIFFPMGSYIISNTLSVLPGCVLEGELCDDYNNPAWLRASRIIQTNTTKGGINFKDLLNQSVRKLSIRGPRIAGLSTVGLSISNGVAAPCGERFFASQVSISGFGYAVETDSPSGVLFEHCYFYENTFGQALLENYVDTVTFRNCNLGYNTNGLGGHLPAPIIVTTATANLKNLTIENCEIGDSDPAIYCAGGGAITVVNCNFERAKMGTNLFVLNGSTALSVIGCRINDFVTNAIVRGQGAGNRAVTFLNNETTWGNHTAKVEGATGVPLLYEDEEDNLASFSSNARSGVWRTLSGATWTYRAPSFTPSIRAGASLSSSLATRGRITGSFSDDSAHATGKDGFFFDGYFNSATIGRRFFATTTNEFFGGSNTFSGNVWITGGNDYSLIVSNRTAGPALSVRSAGPLSDGTVIAEFGCTNANPLTLKLGIIGSATASSQGFWWQSSSTGLSDNKRLALQPYGGVVGIGTATPAYTLDVSGTFRSTGAAIFGSTLTASNGVTAIGTNTFNGCPTNVTGGSVVGQIPITVSNVTYWIDLKR